VQSGIYIGICLLFISYFSYLQTQLFKTQDLKTLFDQLAVTRIHVQKVPRGLKTILLLCKDNIVTSLLNIVNSWRFKTLFERVLAGVQVSALVGLMVYSLKHARQWFVKEYRFLIGVSFVLSLITFIGFLFGRAATEKYMVALVPNVYLLLSLAFTATKKNKDAICVCLILSIFILGTFLYNGFSVKNVLRGCDIMDHQYYSQSITIKNTLSEGEKAYYFSLGTRPYLMNAVLGYYKYTFSTIDWKRVNPDKSPKEIYALMDSVIREGTDRIFLEKALVEKLKLEDRVTAIGDDVYRYNRK